MASTRAQRLSLVERVPPHPEADGAADAAIEAWRQLEATLVPLIGRRGFVALYERCIALQSKQDPWLRHAHDSAQAWDDFHALQRTLGSRPGAQAALAQRQLLRVFREVLTSLLGAPLVAKVLGPIEGGPP